MTRLLHALIFPGAVMVACDGTLPLFSELHGQAGDPGDATAGAPGSAASGGMAGTVSPAGGAAGLTDGGVGGESPDAIGGAGAGTVIGLKIDDFEDGDTHAEPPLGWWYKVNDGTGTQSFDVEPSSAKQTGASALHSRGEGFTGWGAVVGVNFAGASVIDASGFKTLSFLAVAVGANKQLTVDLIASGDVRYYAPALTLSERSATYRVPLSEFRGKNQTPLDPTQLQGMQLEIPAGAAFDLWLDDVEFLP